MAERLRDWDGENEGIWDRGVTAGYRDSRDIIGGRSIVVFFFFVLSCPSCGRLC